MTLVGQPSCESCFSKSGGGESFEYALKHNMSAGKTLTIQPAHSIVFDEAFDKSDGMTLFLRVCMNRWQIAGNRAYDNKRPRAAWLDRCGDDMPFPG
jgi:hypothetical protein